MDKIKPAETKTPTAWVIAKCLTIIGVALSLFQLYTAGMVAMTAMRHRSVFLTCILAMTFLIKPLYKSARKDRINVALVVDLVLIAISIFAGLYIFIDLQGIFERQGDWSPWDFRVGVAVVLLVLEATRRVIGLNLMIIACLALLFGYFGPWMPELIVHKGYSIERIATTLSLTTEGIFGLPLGVASTFVFIFILFGAFLDKTGAGSFFINLSYSITGRFSGGPAKTAVVASGFMGSVAGSAVANVVATGSFTIPMMKKIGYRKHVAAAVEAAASTGGQLMPPIMGAGAFLMAEFTQTPYLEIIKIAFIPAVLYFFSVILFVHFEAQKQGIWGLPKDQLPNIVKTLKAGIHFIIPVAILITVLVMNYSPMMAGFIAILAVYFTALIRKGSRISFATLIKTLEQGARNAIVVAVACAAAGIIVGIVNLTGTGLRFSSLVVSLSQGIPLLALLLVALTSLFLGMGLPVTASYIVLIILAGPGLMDLGIPLLTAHMVVFWYSQDANVTPPGSPGILCRLRNCRFKPHENRLYFLETGQGSLYNSHHHGLPSAAVKRAHSRSHQNGYFFDHRLCGLSGTLFPYPSDLAGNDFAGRQRSVAHLGQPDLQLYRAGHIHHPGRLPNYPQEKTPRTATAVTQIIFSIEVILRLSPSAVSPPQAD